MRKGAVLTILLLVTACERQSPTEPHLAAATAPPPVYVGCNLVGATVDPPRIAIRSGSTYDATVQVCYPPAAAPWTFSVGPAHIAEGTVVIPAGGRMATLRITAKSPGAAYISYTVPNFGRAPSTQAIGEVSVEPAAPPPPAPPVRRRSVGR